MVYAWSVLKNSNIETKDIIDVKRIVALCAINLKERGLFEDAINWLKTEPVRNEIENEPENPKIKKDILNGMESFAKILKSYDQTIDVDQFISDYAKIYKKDIL